MNHNNHDDYKTIDEHGNPIADSDTAKEHIADYFENLYQAREGEQIKLRKNGPITSMKQLTTYQRASCNHKMKTQSAYKN